MEFLSILTTTGIKQTLFCLMKMDFISKIFGHKEMVVENILLHAVIATDALKNIGISVLIVRGLRRNKA